MESDNITKSIIKTLCYGQVFSYPLTLPELWKYLISPKKISGEELVTALKVGKSGITQVQKYIVFPGDEKLVVERTMRTQESKRKLRKALWISQVLSVLPSIKLVAVSGSLSMHNAKPKDDIDLFIITAKDRLWTTRFLVNTILIFLREKRSRKGGRATDKICPNMFISEDSLEIPTHNLYTAHEVAQIKVLFSRDNMYHRFLKSNKWVLRFMPHAFSLEKEKEQFSGQKPRHLILSPLVIVEYALFCAQYVYMKRKITNEKIKKNMAAFHPIRQGDMILTLYKLKVKYYEDVLKVTQHKRNLPQFRPVN